MIEEHYSAVHMLASMVVVQGKFDLKVVEDFRIYISICISRISLLVLVPNPNEVVLPRYSTFAKPRRLRTNSDPIERHSIPSIHGGEHIIIDLNVFWM